jgi:hypothetical protein
VAAHEQVHFFAGVIRNLMCLITYNEKKGGRGKLKRYRAAGVLRLVVESREVCIALLLVAIDSEEPC